MITPEQIERLRRAAITLDLQCETLRFEDLRPAVAERPLDLALRISAGACTVFTPSSRGFFRVPEATLERLFAAAAATFAEGDHDAEIDTAIARDVTTFTVRVESPTTLPRTARLALNHCGPRRATRSFGWAALLSDLGDLMAPRGEDLARWSDAMTFLTEGSRTPTLERGEVVPVPAGCHAWSLWLRDGIFLRLGQPPGASTLFLVTGRPDGAEVRRVLDDGAHEVVAHLPASEPRAHWTPIAAGAPYRDAPGEPEVEVHFVSPAAITGRAGRVGRGVSLQRVARPA
jgi:hypothetical protein